MAKMQRHKTKYAGVFYIEAQGAQGRKKEKVYYIRYRKDGKQIEEKAGRQYQDDMTAARAAGVRAHRIEGKQASNAAQRKAEKGRWTFQRLWDEYESHRKPGESLKIDRGRYEKFLKGPFGKIEPSKLVQINVERLRINLLKTKSPQSVKHILALLKRLINFGLNKGLCAGPSFNITLPKVDNIKTEDLNSDQLKKLFEVLETTPYTTAADMMRLALFTGMRRGEIFKLKWDDIDFHRGFINIRDPKGGVDQKIPLNDKAHAVFDAITPSADYVFPARNGGPRVAINKDLAAIKKDAGLPKDFRPLHGLRHLYATLLASSGQVDMIALQKLLTHKDQRMTQRYVHYRDEALKRASNLAGDIMDRALTGAKIVNIK